MPQGCGMSERWMKSWPGTLISGAITSCLLQVAQQRCVVATIYRLRVTVWMNWKHGADGRLCGVSPSEGSLELHSRETTSMTLGFVFELFNFNRQ